MLEVVRQKVRDVVGRWRGERDNIRRRTEHDAVADTLESCAQDADEMLREIEMATETLTPEQFAQLHGVTPQTVTYWCRKKHIVAECVAGKWKVPRDAKPPQLRSTRSA